MVVDGAVVLMVASLVAVAASASIGYFMLNLPWLRAGIGAVVVQVVLRFELDTFFGASALMATGILGLIVITGVRRRRRFVRRRVLWGGLGLVAAAILAVLALALQGVQQRESIAQGYQLMLKALDHLESGDVRGAQGAIEEASHELDGAADRLNGLAGQPSRLVPIAAQNRVVAVDLLGRVSILAGEVADALAVVDLDRLQVVDGSVEIEAVKVLAEPLAQVEAAVTALRSELDAADSPWLVGPVRRRLAVVRDQAERVTPQIRGLTALAREGPAMLGADGSRRYLFAFVNPAEARAQSGLMGNWSELVVDQGRVRVARSGRTAELQQALDQGEVFVEERDEFFARYRTFGAGQPPDEPVAGDLWANITMTPDMPTVGRVMAQLYEVSTGHRIDGVFVLTPAGIAALLGVSGPIEVDGLDFQLTAQNVEQFLLVDQYEFVEEEREDLLEAVTSAAIDRVLSTTLLPPHRMAAVASDAVLHGHIAAWAVRPEEQGLLELVGMDAALPAVGAGAWTGDAVAVVNDNANPNKIDTFLERSVHYRAVVDETTGAITVEARVELTNTAPTSGLVDYVIGNRHGLSPGSNRTALSVLSPHRLVEYRLDGQQRDPWVMPELGWNTATLFIDIPPGATVTAELKYRGQVAAGPYRLLVRPQPLPNADAMVIEVVSSNGSVIIDRAGPILRRSVVTADGVQAWRSDLRQG